MEIFDEMTFFTEEDFDDEFLKKYGSHFRDYKRGYGYWSWKPYFILQELNRLNEGDTVVYADAGCMLLNKNRNKLAEWIDIASSSDSGILSPCYGPYIEHEWTRGDLHEYIDKTYNKNHIDIFDKALQCGATVMVICKKKKSVEFVKNWLDVMTEHFHLCTDEPSSVPNHPDFKENRHDQSVFSMLSKIYGIETIETKYGVYDKENSPIFAARCRNDKYTWKKTIDYAINPKSRDIEKPKKISIITVNYNNKVGLVNTINSVLRQTYYNNIEYIVIDGGSTDGSADLIRQCSEKLFYSVSEKDNGIYEAMNKGIEKATGDYCLFLNSGDYFCNNSVIESAVRYLDKDIVYGDIKLNGRMVKKYSSTLDVHYFDYESLPHPASFIKTSLLKDRNYDTDFNIISDWIFFRESIARGVTYRHIDLPISNFFLGGKSSDEKALSKEKEKYFSSDGKWKNEITVIVPCYNYGKYIAETLDSLKTSTYQDFHCIIVNDGSTDDSEEIIKNAIAGDNRFEYFRIDNHGVGYARNYGIRKSDSKYILCLDSDDKISPTYIENGIKYLNENDDVTLYYGNAQMFFDDGTSSDWYLPEFNYSRLLLSNQIYCSFIYRRSDYNRCGGYDEVMHGYEDWEFLVRLLDGKKVYRTDDVVFYYRRHNDSKDAQVSKDVRSYLRYIIGKNIPVYMKYGLITDNKKQDKSSLLAYNNVNKQSDNVSFVSVESLR